MAAESSCDTRPFSGEWFQGLGVALSNSTDESALTNAKLAPPCTQTRTQTVAGRCRAGECFAPQREHVTIPLKTCSARGGAFCDAAGAA